MSTILCQMVLASRPACIRHDFNPGADTEDETSSCFMSVVLRLLSANRLNASKKINSVAPHERLGCLKTIWQSIQLHSVIENKWHRQEKLLPEIANFRTLLIDECVKADSSAPNACLQFALKKEIFHWLITIAITGPSSVTRTIVHTLTELIEVQNDDFLSHEAIFWNLNVLFRWFAEKTYKGTPLLPMAELLFATCTKILHCPLLLPMFFKGRAVLTQLKSQSKVDVHKVQGSDGVQNCKDDFLLYYLLLDNLQVSGKVGDFCRTGLLYLLETARKDLDLMEWFERSDMAESLSSGLAVHYSYIWTYSTLELGGTSSDSCESAKTPDIVPGKDRQEILAEQLESLALRSDMDTSQTYLAYWEDVYEIVCSDTLRQRLLYSYRQLFLHETLHHALSRTLHETSCLAVCACLSSILDVLRMPAVADTTIGFLFDERICSDLPNFPAFSLRARFSGQVHEVVFHVDGSSLPDYIMRMLSSSTSDGSLAAMTLLDSLVVHHWRLVAPLFCTGRPMTKANACKNSHHVRYLQSLVPLTEAEHHSTQTLPYHENHVYDAHNRLTAQCENLSHLLSPLDEGSAASTSVRAQRCVLQESDALLMNLVPHLQCFFDNDIQLNLALTKLLTDLLSSPHQALEGLILSKNETDIENDALCDASPMSPDMQFPDDLEQRYNDEFDSAESSILTDDSVDSTMQGLAAQIDYDKSNDTGLDLPPLLASLQSLAAQVQQYKIEHKFGREEMKMCRSLLESVCNLANAEAQEKTSQRMASSGSAAQEGIKLLSNIFIFEEFIKEVIATVQVRQSLWGGS